MDEYQDINADQYELISALAGRTLEEEDRKLTLFAVGDDDQNTYAFNGASVEFIRRFEADYGPKPAFLVDNYRSTDHIVAAANALIEPARHRMKTGHPIRHRPGAREECARRRLGWARVRSRDGAGRRLGPRRRRGGSVRNSVFGPPWPALVGPTVVPRRSFREGTSTVDRDEETPSPSPCDQHPLPRSSEVEMVEFLAGTT